MQKMQLDTGFNQKCTKKTEEEAFRMLLYGILCNNLTTEKIQYINCFFHILSLCSIQFLTASKLASGPTSDKVVKLQGDFSFCVDCSRGVKIYRLQSSTSDKVVQLQGDFS